MSVDLPRGVSGLARSTTRSNAADASVAAAMPARPARPSGTPQATSFAVRMPAIMNVSPWARFTMPELR